MAHPAVRGMAGAGRPPVRPAKAPVLNSPSATAEAAGIARLTPAILAKLVVTMFFWGGTWIAGRVVVQEVPPLAAAFWRFLTAGLALAAVAVVSEGGLPKLSRQEWLTVTLLGLSGIALYNFCFLFGLKHIAAGRGALVVALNPAVVALSAWLFFGDRMTPPKALGIVLAMAGCLLVIANDHPTRLFAGAIGLGEVLILGCVVFWAIYTFIGRRATATMSALAATAYASLIGCAMLGAAAAVNGDLGVPDYSPTAWSAILFLGLLGTALSFTWYADSVQRVGPARTAAFINLVPLFAVLQGAWLLGERLSTAAYLGGALTIVGVMFTTGVLGGRRLSQ